MAGFFDIGLGPIAEVLKELISLFPNAEQRERAAKAIQDLQLAIANNQSATNTAEAGNASFFVSGWRPFVGWSCAAGFVYATIVAPVFGLTPPDVSALVAILTGMLGLGSMRTVEKVTGKAK